MVIKVRNEAEAVATLLQRYGLSLRDLSELAQIKKGLLSPKKSTVANCTMTLTEGTANFLITKKSMSELTVKGYKSDLNHFQIFMEERWDEKKVQDRVVTNITNTDITIFLNSLKPRRKGSNKIKPSSKNRKLAAIRGLFQYLIDEEIIEKSPAHKVSWSQEGTLPIMFLTKEEQIKILKTAKLNKQTGTRDLLIIFLLLNSGIRLSELFRLDISDIDIEKNQLHVIGKGDKFRPALLHQDVKEDLIDYIKTRRFAYFQRIKDLKKIPLFINEKGPNANKRLSKAAIQQMITRVFRACNIHEGSVHRRRHSFAINCLELGINIVHIMHLLGHENISTTVGYLRISDEMVLREVRSKFPLAFVSIENFAEFVSGREGKKIQNAMHIVKKENPGLI